jgi:hypothetical protein
MPLSEICKDNKLEIYKFISRIIRIFERIKCNAAKYRSDNFDHDQVLFIVQVNSCKTGSWYNNDSFLISSMKKVKICGM